MPQNFNPSRIGPDRLIRQADLALFSMIPGVSAVARDQNLRLFWCNETYRANFADNLPLERLVGTTMEDLVPTPAAAERAAIQRQVIQTREPLLHYQLSGDRRVLCMVMPLDPASFGHEGILATVSETLTLPSWADAPSVPTLHTPANLGSLRWLTRRELEVLHHAAQGLTAPEIAARIFRSTKTVENHIAAIHDKLALHTKGALIRYRTERGLHAFSAEEWSSIIEQMSGHSTDDTD